jgi:hypothetical protein
MTRLVKVALTIVAVLAIGAAVLVAQTKPPVAPVRGEVEIGVMPPQTKVDEPTKMVITTIRVKNLSPIGSIAGLKVEAYWYDKANNPVNGGRAKLAKPLLPGEIATLTIEMPKDPKMFRDQYVFSHANGKVKVAKNAKF